MTEPVSPFTDYKLRVPDVARLLGYHEQYVRFLATHGRLPAIKRGRLWLFSEAEIFDRLQKETQNFLEAKNDDDGKTNASDLLQ